MMRHYIIGMIIGIGLGLAGVMTAQSSDVSSYVVTNGHTALPQQRVTINPQATFIVLHRTLDPMAVLCIERRSVELDTLIGELPPRVCKTIQDWTR